MQISAIISEYNPLHKGHVHHINKTREVTNSDAIICIMSGNYVQRGTPAVIDKWNRTKNALQCGIDLVIELPVLYSLSSAEFFAYGAVSLINSLGVTNSLSFGSELGDINSLFRLSEFLVKEPEEYKMSLRTYLNKGYTYPTSRSKALIEYISHNSLEIAEDVQKILTSSNNILAIEYCKSLIKLQSGIKPFTIKREGGSYTSETLDISFASATAIRKYLKENNNFSELVNHLPKPTFNLLNELASKNYRLTSEDHMLPFIKFKYFNYKDQLLKLPDVSEGLHNKIYKALDSSTTYDDAIGKIKSKRYTYTRISRILSQFYVGFDNFNTELLRSKPCPYARILGFNETGRNILKIIKANSDIPMYSKLPKSINEVLELDILATKSYSLLNNEIAPNSDYLISPIKLKDIY